ncbi:AMP-binding protein, partial [Streptomyces sp. NPDC005534]
MSGTTAEATFPQLLHRLAVEHPHRPALREKRYGTWQPLTWAEYAHQVRLFAGGLSSLGFKHRETLLVLGDSRPQQVIAGLAAQSLGGSSANLDPGKDLTDAAHVITHRQIRFAVAGNQEEEDALVALRQRGQAGTLTYIIRSGRRDLARDGAPYQMDFSAVQAHADQPPSWWVQQVTHGRPDDVALLCTVPNTSGGPELAMFTHKNLLWAAASLLSQDPAGTGDEFMSLVPLPGIKEQVISVACSLQAGFALNFPESPTTARTDLHEIGPQVVSAPSWVWESMLHRFQDGIDDAGRFKRAVFGWGAKVGRHVADLRMQGGRLSTRPRLAHLVAQAVALRPARRQLGLTRTRHAYADGAPLSTDALQLMRAIGVGVRQLYGPTQCCGTAALERDGSTTFTLLPGTDLQITDGGEVLLRSPAVFAGYYHAQQATAAALADGWLHTGDTGRLNDDGRLVITGRAQTATPTHEDTPFDPAPVESRLTLSPHITHAVVSGGEGRPCVAVILIAGDSVGAWAKRNRIPFSDHADLAQK